MTNGSRFLVTGAAGFIGGHLARSLAADGCAVTTLDTRHLEPITREMDGITEITGDIRDAPTVAKAVGDVDVIFHQAAMASVPESFADPALCMSINTVGSANIFEQARLAGVKRVVMASTSAVYGDDPTPVKHEGLIPAPRSPYAVSKLAMEQLADVYAREFGMEMIAFRYFNVYGPGQPAEGGYAAVMPAIRKAIRTGQPFDLYGDGGQSRSFIYVGDIVRANIAAALVDVDPGEGVIIANLASDQVVSLNTLLHTFEHVVGHKIEVNSYPEREGDIRNSAGDTSFAHRRFGFTADIPLVTGISRLIESDS